LSGLARPRHYELVDADDRLWTEALYKSHAPAVYRYARSLVGPTEAEDIVQDTFLDAAAKWRLRSDIGLAWLLVSARNRARNLRRRVAASALLDAELVPVVSPYEARMHLQALLDAWAHLTVREREFLTLAAILELPIAEIAQVVDRTPEATRKAIGRARTRLRAIYDCGLQ
jgi:RNA polymerase sigma-70 factor, ECF subfamily